jgi:predicted deacylase
MATPRVDMEYPVELIAPDISPYRRGNIGIEFAATYDSGRAGPHVLISALVHGNELCGAIALDWLHRQDPRPVAGKLTLVFANADAYALWDAADPTISRWVDEDLNRLWSDTILDGPRDSAELRRARALRPIVADANLLLDIHSMQTGMPPLLLSGPLARGRDLARKVGMPALVVADSGHAQGPRMRDYGSFSDPASTDNALLVEAGQHWAKSSADMAIETAVRFLRASGIFKEFAPDIGTGITPTQRFVEVTQPVTITAERFTFAQPFIGGEVLAKCGTLVGWDGDVPIATPYDDCVLIMPTRRPWKGMTAVRFGRFIESKSIDS